MDPKIKMILLTTWANSYNCMEEGNLDIRDRAMKIARGELYYILLEYILKERIFSLNGLFLKKH